MLDHAMGMMDSDGFMPHGFCFLWQKDILLLHVISDAGIAFAYYLIPILLFYLVRKKEDLPYKKVFAAFCTFIFLCGTTHLLSIWVLWHPDYAVEGIIKALTAIVSIATLFVLWKVVPGVLKMINPAVGKLRASETRLRALVDNALDGIITIDKHGRVESFNPACEAIFWYKAEEVIGQNIKCLMPESYHGQHDDYLYQYLNTGKGKVIGAAGREVSGKRKDGSVFPMDLAISVLELEDGLHFSGIIRDISERKKGEATRALLAAIVESSDDGIISKTLDGVINSWNAGAERIFGYTSAEAIGKSMTLIIPSDRRIEEEIILKQIRQGKSIEHFETVRISEDGRFINVSLTISPIHDEKGDIVGASKVVRDISERKRTEEALKRSEAQLRQAQKMEAIGNLTGGMAHDFNNLLGVVIGNLDLVLDRLKDDGEIKMLSQEALDAALRGADLTRRLLAFARQQPLQPQQVDVNKLVEGIMKLLSRTLGEDIQIVLELGEGVWPVVVDPAQLEAALTNLTTNARDAMLHGGQLIIATHNRHLDIDYAAQFPEVTPGDYAAIEVSDTGAGISKEVISRIFEPFFTTKSRGKGTGLGLSMVFGFVKQSGGHINVYSELNAGTTFRIYLPRMTAEAAVAAHALSAAMAAGGHETILVVEDNEGMRKVVARQLDELGYRVLEAENATLALEKLDSAEEIDLLFTDIVMPGKLNGFELADLAIKRWPKLKVVLTSGFPETKLNGNGDKAVDLRLLSKPYRKQDLARVLREAFGEKPHDV